MKTNLFFPSLTYFKSVRIRIITNTMKWILASRLLHSCQAILSQNGWWVKIKAERTSNSSLHSNYKYFTYQIYFGRALNTNKSNNKMNRNNEYLKVLRLYTVSQIYIKLVLLIGITTKFCQTNVCPIFKFWQQVAPIGGDIIKFTWSVGLNVC